MKRIALVTIAFLLFLLTQASPLSVQADEPIHWVSAALREPYVEDMDFTSREDLVIRKVVVSRVLKRNNSPLSPFSWKLVATEDKYGLDPYILLAIARLESTYGKHVLPGSLNPFGWASGMAKWDSWDRGIEEVGWALRYEYIDKGATTVAAIGSRYASSPTWSLRVEKFVADFYNEEQLLKREGYAML